MQLIISSNLDFHFHRDPLPHFPSSCSTLNSRPSLYFSPFLLSLTFFLYLQPLCMTLVLITCIAPGLNLFNILRSMDLKVAEEEEKEMIIRSNDLLQLPNPLPNSSQRVIRQKPTGSRYRECMKNHAASIGGNVLDGCGEFMPAGEEGTAESLKCAACNCHRNFHRRQSNSSSVEMGVHPLQLPPPLQMKMGFGTESSSEELVNLNSGGDPSTCFVMSKKRFRTKFTQEQKEKMVKFAEKVGWRIPREDDLEARKFCIETGVKRHVLKVWMHNNKIAKKEEMKKNQ